MSSEAIKEDELAALDLDDELDSDSESSDGGPVEEVADEDDGLGGMLSYFDRHWCLCMSRFRTDFVSELVDLLINRFDVKNPGGFQEEAVALEITGSRSANQMSPRDVVQGLCEAVVLRYTSLVFCCLPLFFLTLLSASPSSSEQEAIVYLSAVCLPSGRLLSASCFVS